MENTKEEISFSVNLSASKNIQEKDMKLTFFGEEKPLLFDEEFNLLPSITKTMQMSKYGQNISNIIDVLPNSEKYNMNDF
ncbi:MAG: hypothetical protein GY870_18790, partial [archaeon]|nr:hypothetical protein [archaeon]